MYYNLGRTGKVIHQQTQQLRLGVIHKQAEGQGRHEMTNNLSIIANSPGIKTRLGKAGNKPGKIRHIEWLGIQATYKQYSAKCVCATFIVVLIGNKCL